MKCILLTMFGIFSALLLSSQDLDTISFSISQKRKLNRQDVVTNLQMNDVYTEVNPISFIAPLGEIGSGKKYLFSADIHPLFFISGGVRSRFNIGLSPRVKIRMFNDSSFAVRTPSFEPSIRIYFRLNESLEDYKYFELDVFHHSNGQDAKSILNGDWNTYNGNFSTNYIIIGYNRGKYSVQNMNHWGIALQQHFAIKGALEQDTNLKGKYGQLRLNANFLKRYITRISYPDPSSSDNSEIFALYKEKIRIQGSVSYILTGLDNISLTDVARRLNAELSFHRSFKTWKKVSLFGAIGYYGEDPYNIYFNKRYGFLRFGISTGSMYFKIDPEYVDKLK